MVKLTAAWAAVPLVFTQRLIVAGLQSIIGRPSEGWSQFLLASTNLSDVDIATGSRFSGLTTFAHIPYVNCFEDPDGPTEPFDIAFIGAPFDTAVTARPGARFGPTAIRLGSTRMSEDFAYDIFTGHNPFRDWAKVVDCGDVPMTVLDNNYALRQLEKGHRIATGQPTVASPQSRARLIALGGDHTTTLSALRAAHDTWGNLSVIHFDAHIDTWDPQILGGGISDYSAINHGTFLHIAHEEGLISNTSIHVGIRAPVARRKGDLRNDLRCGFDIVHAREIDQVGVNGIIERIKDRVQDSKIYLSIDIDVLDPAFAPATGTPEVAGWSTRELLAVLDGLAELSIVGADVVEVAPAYEVAGEATALAAAEVALKMMSLMVKKRL